MKIGIIGLKPNQLTDIKSRNASNGVEFYDRKVMDREHVAAFASKLDLVVVMMPHVPKQAIDGVPQTKRHMMHGSISTVIRFLESRRAMSDMGETTRTDVRPLEVRKPPKLAPKSETGIARAVIHSKPPEAKPEVKGKKRATNTLPKMGEGAPPLIAVQTQEYLGFEPATSNRPKYVWSAVTAVTQREVGGMFNYDILDAAVVGDVVRFHHYSDEDVLRYRSRIHSLRDYRRRMRGQYFEAYLFEDYVDMHLVVEGTNAKSKKQKAKAAPTRPFTTASLSDASASPIAPSAVAPVTVVEPAPAQGSESTGVAVEVKGDSVEPERTWATQAPLEIAKVVDLTQEPFWCQAYLVLLGQGRSVEDAGAGADEALLQRQRRFS